MKPYRGLTKEGKLVYGWYCKRGRRLYIFDPKYSMQFLACFIEVIPETVGQFVTKDKNKKAIYRGDETNKGIAIAAFQDWVWTYKKDPSTYHWHINIKEDIELIEDKEDG